MDDDLRTIFISNGAQHHLKIVTNYFELPFRVDSQFCAILEILDGSFNDSNSIYFNYPPAPVTKIGIHCIYQINNVDSVSYLCVLSKDYISKKSIFPEIKNYLLNYAFRYNKDIYDQLYDEEKIARNTLSEILSRKNIREKELQIIENKLKEITLKIFEEEIQLQKDEEDRKLQLQKEDEEDRKLQLQKEEEERLHQIQLQKEEERQRQIQLQKEAKEHEIKLREEERIRKINLRKEEKQYQIKLLEEERLRQIQLEAEQWNKFYEEDRKIKEIEKLRILNEEKENNTVNSPESFVEKPTENKPSKKKNFKKSKAKTLSTVNISLEEEAALDIFLKNAILENSKTHILIEYSLSKIPKEIVDYIKKLNIYNVVFKSEVYIIRIKENYEDILSQAALSKIETMEKQSFTLEYLELIIEERMYNVKLFKDNIPSEYKILLMELLKIIFSGIFFIFGNDTPGYDNIDKCYDEQFIVKMYPNIMNYFCVIIIEIISLSFSKDDFNFQRMILPQCYEFLLKNYCKAFELLHSVKDHRSFKNIRRDTSIHIFWYMFNNHGNSFGDIHNPISDYVKQSVHILEMQFQDLKKKYGIK